MLSYRQAECGDHGQEDVVFDPRQVQTSEQQDQHRPQQGMQVCVCEHCYTTFKKNVFTVDAWLKKCDIQIFVNCVNFGGKQTC